MRDAILTSAGPTSQNTRLLNVLWRNLPGLGAILRMMCCVLFANLRYNVVWVKKKKEKKAAYVGGDIAMHLPGSTRGFIHLSLSP